VPLKPLLYIILHMELVNETSKHIDYSNPCFKHLVDRIIRNGVSNVEIPSCTQRPYQLQTITSHQTQTPKSTPLTLQRRQNANQNISPHPYHAADPDPNSYPITTTTPSLPLTLTLRLTLTLAPTLAPIIILTLLNLTLHTEP